MTLSKVLMATLATSVTAHALVAYSLSGSWGNGYIVTVEPIQIDSIRREVPKAGVVSSGPVGLQTLEKKIAAKRLKGIPASWKNVTADRPSPTPPTDFQKIVDEKIKKQLQQIKRLEEPAPAAPSPRVSSSMTGAELMADPAKGKVFVGYFGAVKKKIQSTVYQKASRHNYGSGTVCLGFVLNTQGYLEKVAVIEKGTSADEGMKALAVQCLRESAPFGKFPKDLGPDRITFNITIFFDGTV